MSAHNHIVIFEDGKKPRILFNVDPNLFHPDTILVNPMLPRGVPPHRWKKVGKEIHVLPDERKYASLAAVSIAISKPKPSLKHYLLMGLASLAISIFLKLLLH